jgi:hypothetical protein
MFSTFTFSVLVKSQPANSSQDPILKITTEKKYKAGGVPQGAVPE